MMKVIYLGHSGFFVEMEDACFLFDYYKGDLPEADRGKKLLYLSATVIMTITEKRSFLFGISMIRCATLFPRIFL